ncbi:MAG: TOBE domain-containing protein, partial [Burkholderiaceae bacterium]
ALLARPEDVEVAVGAAGSEDWGHADVVQRSFLGDRVQLTLRVADQGAPLRADVARDHPAQAGDRVGIRIHPERLMPLAEETTP